MNAQWHFSNCLYANAKFFFHNQINGNILEKHTIIWIALSFWFFCSFSLNFKFSLSCRPPSSAHPIVSHKYWIEYYKGQQIAIQMHCIHFVVKGKLPEWMRQIQWMINIHETTTDNGQLTNWTEKGNEIGKKRRRKQWNLSKIKPLKPHSYRITGWFYQEEMCELWKNAVWFRYKLYDMPLNDCGSNLLFTYLFIFVSFLLLI